MLGFARITSFLLGPFFTLFPILFILVAKFSDDYSHALEWALFSYIFVLVVVIFVIAGVVLGYFSNFDVSKREQRPLLFYFVAFVSLCYYLSLLIFDGPKILIVGFFAIVLGLITIAIVNKWIKASIHMMTATAAFLLISLAYKGYFFLFLIPLLAWARVKTKEHSPKEAIIGCILGIVLTLIVYLITKQFFLKMVYN
jgi:putative transposase